MRHLYLITLLGALGLSAQAAQVSVDTLSPDDVSKAVAAIRENYVRKDSLTDSDMARATLQGLLDRLSSAVTLTATESAPVAAPFYSEAPDGKTGYLRVGALNPRNVDLAKQVLATWTAQDIGAVVLDLRGSPASDDFTTTAATLAGCFCPKGTMLLGLESEPPSKAEMESSTPPDGAPASNANTKLIVRGTQTTVRDYAMAKGSPVFSGVLVVLIDSDTAQAPEALAAFLQKCAKALVVGDKSAGQPYSYHDIPLGGATLRVAVAQAVLPDGAKISGVTPDIAVGIGSASRETLMETVSARGVASVTSERDRPHLNEVALVTGSDPEVDELEAEQSAQKPAQPLIDRQLQRALDLVTSISIYQAKSAAVPPGE
jgi:hypothetical protein